VTGSDVDLVTVGETMATFVRAGDPDAYRLITAGAESNVAAGMVALGCRARWHSRLGADELGGFVADSLTAAGVLVLAERDVARPTGAAVKEVGPSGSRMRYYRTGSAASRLDLLDSRPLVDAPLLHLTGITPALSPENHSVVARLLAERRGATSFDVNYRPVLWPSAEDAAGALLPLARSADLIFIGDDEARALVGTDDVRRVAEALLRRPGQELVVKFGPSEAVLATAGSEVSEPAHSVEVVDLTGAGDAFAAGYLTATVWGWAPHARLRLGHTLAAQVVGVVGDTVPGIDRQTLVELAADLGQTLPNPPEERRR